MCKPVNIIHNLKLDQSYTGLQTLGAETIVEVMVYNAELTASASNSSLVQCSSEVNEEEGKSQSPKQKSEPELLEVSSKDDWKQICKNSSSDAEDSRDRALTTPSSPSPISAKCPQPDAPPDERKCEKLLMNIKAEPEEDDVPDEDLMESSCWESTAPPLTQISNNANCRMTVQRVSAESDHDYFQTSAAQVKKEKWNESVEEMVEPTNKKSLPSRSIAIALPPVHGNIPDLSSLATNVKPIGGLASTSKPAVLVKCLNKNGTVINLPLELLRNAVVIKPQRPMKLGDGTTPSYSVLRFPLVGAAQQDPSTITTRFVKALPTPESASPLPPSLTVIQTKSSSKIHREKLESENNVMIEKRRFQQIMNDVQATEWQSMRDCLRKLAKLFPLVDPQSSNSAYRSLRPFTAPSIEVFCSWHIGKQRSAEWMRSKLLNDTLHRCRFSSSDVVWHTKKIMLWCRRQGYSPLACWPGREQPSESSTSSLTTLPSPIVAININDLPVVACKEDDCIVDIEAVATETTAQNSVDAYSSQCSKSLLPLNDSDSVLTSWITDSVEKLGFKLGSELHDDSLMSIARLVMSSVWKEFANDLVRRSLRESWQRNGGQKPDVISLTDVYHAINRRPECDVLTCFGMGVNKNE